MKILLALLISALPVFATDLLTPRLPDRSAIDDQVGEPVAIDPKSVVATILSSEKNRLLVQAENSFVVKDGSGRMVRSGDVYFMLFPDGAPTFPTDATISTKINPIGSLVKYITTMGAERTVYAFEVVAKVREQK